MNTPSSITVRVPLAIRQRPGRKTIVMPEGATEPTRICGRADPAMVKALARAHRWKRMLEEGRFASISEMAVAERVDRGFLGRLLRLTLLAPDIVEAVLDGTQPADLALPALLQSFPAVWGQQRAIWMIAAAAPKRPAATAAAFAPAPLEPAPLPESAAEIRP
jgi:hypothetical protein